MSLLKRLIPFLLPILLLTGCVRTIYVPHGTPVRLRQTVKNAKVWVKDADGKPVAGQMDIPNGWYALPVSIDEKPACPTCPREREEPTPKERTFN